MNNSIKPSGLQRLKFRLFGEGGVEVIFLNYLIYFLSLIFKNSILLTAIAGIQMVEIHSAGLLQKKSTRPGRIQMYTYVSHIFRL